MALLDQMIKTGRLEEFISELVEIRNEELEEKATWEFWLHKDFERSYNDCREAMMNSQPPKTITKAELTEIVKQSAEIASFVPPEG